MKRKKEREREKKEKRKGDGGEKQKGLTFIQTLFGSFSEYSRNPVNSSAFERGTLDASRAR